MSDLRLRARSATEIVDAAFQVYRRDMVEFILITAIAYAPLLLAQLLLLGATAAGRFSAAQGALSIVLVIVGFFAFALMTAALSRYSSDSYLGHSPDLGVAVRDVLPKLWRIIAGSFLIWLVMMLGFLPIAVGAALQSIPIILLASLFGFVWAVYMFVRFFAVFQIIVLEDKGAVAALGRSGVLSRGRKGHVLGTLLLVFLIFTVLYVGVMIMGQVGGSKVSSLVLQTLYTIVAYPIIGITQMILYYDTRIRAEGFDIEVMAGALGAAPEPPGALP